MSEELFEVPENWAWTRMVDVADVIGGATPKTSDSANFQGGTIPWLTPADLSGYTSKYIGSGSRFITQKGLASSSARLMPAGTVLFTSRAPIGYVVIASNDICTNQGFKSFVLKSPDILSDFVYWWLKGSKELAESLASGTTFLELSGEKAKQLPFPLAPFNEQTRIIAEIEKQFSRLDEAVANLKRVKANLKRYKAAVLKAAVEGKLTEEWRRQHPDVEPADKLLERILAERRKGAGKFKESVELDTINLSELPAGWVWARYGQVGRLNLGRQRAPKYHTGANMRKYLRVQNVFEDRIDLSDVMEMDFPPDDFEKYELKSGDLLLNEGQSPELLGRPAIYRGELPGACFTNTLIRFRAVEGVSVEFALIVSRHNMRAGRFVDEGTITTNIAHLSLGRLATVEFPLSPYPEQLRIVAEVERCLTIVANADAQVDANLRRADRLRQSILKQAFSGQLVPQDSNDEPASVLLERIRHGVGAIHESPARATRKPKRAIHESPLRKQQQPAETKPATSADFACLDDVTAAILAHMQPDREYARADLADALGLTTGRWNAAIHELKRIGKVRQVGEKRGARYVLNGQVTVA